MKVGIVLKKKEYKFSKGEDENKNKKLVNIVGCILSLVAGWVNAVGLNLFINDSPAFLSGRGLMLGYSALKGDLFTFLSVGLIVLSFIVGAVISTKLTRSKGLGGGLFLTGILITIAALPITLRNVIFDTIIISMAMGAQNAATSLTKINRTTHLTGPATDIGIYIASRNWEKAIFWTLRWISFPIGAMLGFIFVELHNSKNISLSITLFLPAVILLVLSAMQKTKLSIPLLEDEIL